MSVIFPNLVFLCIGLSQCWLRNNIHTKDHESVLGGAKLISKNPQRKHFLGVGMLCQTQFTPHWMLMQREHVSGLFSNHLYVPFQLSPEATSALTFCWALLAFCPKEVTIAFKTGHNVTIWPEMFLLNVVPNWYLETLLLQVDVISAFCSVIHLLNDSTVWCAKTACTYRYVNLQPSQDRS